jgi:hypothetical protein
MRLLNFMFSEADITKDTVGQFIDIDWFVYNNSSDYFDLESTVSYQESEENSWDFSSIDLHATFNMQEHELYFVLGVNEGNGFNEQCEFHYAEDADLNALFDRAMAECTSEAFKGLINENALNVNELKSRLAKLITLLRSQSKH